MQTKRSSSAASDDKSQLDKFKEAARELECDDDERCVDDRMKKLVKHKPVEKPDGA